MKWTCPKHRYWSTPSAYEAQRHVWHKHGDEFGTFQLKLDRQPVPRRPPRTGIYPALDQLEESKANNQQPDPDFSRPSEDLMVKGRKKSSAASFIRKE